MLSRLLGRLRPTVLLPSPLVLGIRPRPTSLKVPRHVQQPLNRPVHTVSPPFYPPLPLLKHLQTRIDQASEILSELDDSERNETIFDTKTLKELVKQEYEGLKSEKESLGIDSGKPMDWRSEIVQAVASSTCWKETSEEAASRRMETVKILVNAIATSPSDSPTLVQYFLDALSGPITLSPSTRDFSTLIDLVQVLLSFRVLEGKIFGRLLDSNARSLLVTCRDLRLQQERQVNNPTLSSHSTSSKCPFSIYLGEGKEVEATPEQLEFIDSPVTPGITALTAHAGTGKSTASLGLCQKIGSENGFSGIVSTRRLRTDLNKRFGRYGKFKTIDSLAWCDLDRTYGRQFRDKFYTESGDLRGLDWKLAGKLLGIDVEQKWMPERYFHCDSDEKVPLLTKRYLSRILAVVESWCASSHEAVRLVDTSLANRSEIWVPPQELIEVTTKLLDRLLDMDDPEAPLLFALVKKKALLDLAFRRFSFPLAEVIIVDEAQDLNECELELCFKFGEDLRFILAGDPLQAIYQTIKGTTSRWTRLPNANVYHLNQTLRFGEEIAAAVNETLYAQGYLGNPIVGGKNPSQLYRSSNVPRRTNVAKLYPRYVDLFLDAPKMASSSRFRLLTSDRFDADNPYSLFIHAAHLYLGRPFRDATASDPFPKTHPNFSSSLAEFKTWEAFILEYNEWSGDLPSKGRKYEDWRTLMQVFGNDETSRRVATEIYESQELFQNPSLLKKKPGDVIGSIPFQVKGLEFDHVLLSSSFPSPQGLKVETYRAGLSHVAMTRAKKTLELNLDLTTFFSEVWGLHRFYVVTNPENAHGFDTRSDVLIGYSTPLPFHPSHVPPTVSSSTSSISRSDFPISIDAALSSPYAPLRNFARFLAGQAQIVEDDIPSGMTVYQALSRRSAMKKRYMKAVQDEVDLAMF